MVDGAVGTGPVVLVVAGIVVVVVVDVEVVEGLDADGGVPGPRDTVREFPPEVKAMAAAALPAPTTMTTTTRTTANRERGPSNSLPILDIMQPSLFPSTMEGKHEAAAS
jgi:hypothetical protein